MTEITPIESLKRFLAQSGSRPGGGGGVLNDVFILREDYHFRVEWNTSDFVLR